ncbi:hypothetical protein [Actinophytocola xanthii]|uniref:DUF4328 domain-containing protein n=1 Tax=Actinophytocola xanthii TaxID=1912961 RepID=A0A1Q8C3L3_9PSEU|nr:hypothetical protein [Actinophytocola xanthii]OLF08948.1 hypothetical protein BU204_33640 [Actinophytocola xanthii]
MASSDRTLPTGAAARPAPLLGPTTASTVLVGATAVAALLDAWTAWYHHGVAVEYGAGTPGVWVSDLTSAASTSRTAGTLYLISLVATAVALLVWVARTRANARLAGQYEGSGYRVLAVAGWFPVSLATVVVTLGTAALLGAEPTLDELARLATLDSAVAVVQVVTAVAVIVLLRRRPVVVPAPR